MARRKSKVKAKAKAAPQPSPRSKAGRKPKPRRAGGSPAGSGGPSGARSGMNSGAKAARKSRFPDVEELVELMDRHGLVEVDVATDPGGLRRLRVSRAAPAAFAAAPPAAPPEAAPPAPAAPVAPAAPARDEGLHAFTSPMVGTFYRAPSPEAPAFVSVGDSVEPTTTICIIEAMKVMNEVQPDTAGTVVSVEVENGEAVEFGQTLFLIRPA